jgi:hypothetical protein
MKKLIVLSALISGIVHAQAGNALYSGSDNVYIANGGALSESGVIRIGTPRMHTAVYLAGVHVLPLYALVQQQSLQIATLEAAVSGLAAKAAPPVTSAPAKAVSAIAMEASTGGVGALGARFLIVLGVLVIVGVARQRHS